MAERPQDIVARGYDAIADRFADWQRGIVGSARLERLDELLALLPERPDVLELGSGAGVRSTRILAEHGRLVGVDISAEQVRRARKRVPGVSFLHADMTELDFDPGSFDAVVSCYVFNHLPREELGPLLRRIAGWLRAGGYLLATFGAGDTPAWRGEWLGTEMFFSGFPAERTLELVAEAGLELARQELETIVEPECGEGRFLWVLARRPG